MTSTAGARAGVFNFEGGCYAKVICLSPEAEPEIYATTRMFGTVLENVVMNPNTRELDFSDATLAENTRACYPIGYIPNASKSGMGGQPKNVVMLTYDAFGVLPPIARLAPHRRRTSSSPAIRQSRRHRDRGERAASHVLHLFPALRSCRCTRRCTASSRAKTSPRTPLASG